MQESVEQISELVWLGSHTIECSISVVNHDFGYLTKGIRDVFCMNF